MWQALKPDTGSDYPQDSRLELLCALLTTLGIADERKEKEDTSRRRDLQKEFTSNESGKFPGSN